MFEISINGVMFDNFKIEYTTMLNSMDEIYKHINERIKIDAFKIDEITIKRIN